MPTRHNIRLLSILTGTLALLTTNMALAATPTLTLIQSPTLPLNIDASRDLYSISGAAKFYRSVLSNKGGQAFTGWSFNTQLNGSNSTTLQPDLLITPSTANPNECQIKVYNPTNHLCTNESIFSLGANGHSVTLNPDIPFWYFVPVAKGYQPPNKCYTHPIAPPVPLKCSADIQATLDLNGNTLKSNRIKISADLYPNNKVVIPPVDNRYIAVNSTGLDQLPNNSGYFLPIFLNGGIPFATPGRTPPGQYGANNGLNDHQEKDLFVAHVSPAGKVTIQGNNSESYTTKDQGQCYYYPTFSLDSQQSGTQTLTLSVGNQGKTPQSPLVVYGHWHAYCPTPPAAEAQPNTIHTISGAVQTRHRFQYGTFQVTMIPSNVQGTNSSFYTFFSNAMIPQPATVTPTGPYYNWGYTWHEIDFEFLPGTHPIGLAPVYLPYGFSRAYASPSTIGHGVSLNSFFPGNVAKGAFGALQHHRYCPNSNDPNCLATAQQIGNLYNGQAHTFTLTWNHADIKYYINGHLMSVLPIENLNNGNANGVPSLARQMLFNNAAITGTNGTAYTTSPQFISMNYWVPTQPGSFGAKFNDTCGPQGQGCEAVYQSVKWSPIVDQGKFIAVTDPSAPPRIGNNVGKVFTTKGTLLPTDEQGSRNWDFTSLDQAQFLQTWMYAPLSGFDSNNSVFVQNNVELNSQGLHLVMMNQWPNMATKGHASTGPLGNPILPDPGAISDTNINQALLVLQIKMQHNQTPPAALQGKVLNGLIPKAQGISLGYLNNGWLGGNGENGCPTKGTLDGKWCPGNGWYADPRLEKVNGQWQATLLIAVPFNKNPQVFDPTVQPSAQDLPSNCSVSYNYPDTLLDLSAQATYPVTAMIHCH